MTPPRAATTTTMNCLLFALLTLVLAACGASVNPADAFPADTSQTDTTLDDGVARGQGQVLSAFFGLDNGLPLGSNFGLCPGATSADGMPVIFGSEVSVDTLQAGDFRVTTQSGRVGEVYCVTLFPALDVGELRTALLVGDFGSARDDPPVTVDIVGSLYSLDGTLDFRGASIAVTPLRPGPTLVLAEIVPQEQWQLGKPAGSGRGVGSGCPSGTTQIVRAVWAGGVVTDAGDEPGDAERLFYRVTLTADDGSARTIAPFALGDLGDGDNNHLLCLDAAGTPTQVAFPAGHLVDPNGDLNPDTAVALP